MSRTAPTSSTSLEAPEGSGATVSAGFERECVEFFADVVGVLGVPRSMGQIYGLLFASPRPLSFTDITEKLDISRGSASQGLHALRSLGAVRVTEVRNERVETGEGKSDVRALRAEMGDRRSKIGTHSGPNSKLPSPTSASGLRRELFEPEKGLRKLVTGVLREKVDPLITDGGARLKKMREEAGAAPDAAGRKFSLDRVKQIETWRRQMGLLLPLLKTVLGPKRD